MLQFESLPRIMIAMVLATLINAVHSLSIHIDGIEPNAGLLSGNTRVLVRGGPFNNITMEYPYPKVSSMPHLVSVNSDLTTESLMPRMSCVIGPQENPSRANQSQQRKTTGAFNAITMIQERKQRSCLSLSLWLAISQTAKILLPTGTIKTLRFGQSILVMDRKTEARGFKCGERIF